MERHFTSINASINTAITQISDTIVGRGPVLGGPEIAAVRPRIAAVRDGVERLAESGEVPLEIAARMMSLTREAETQVAGPLPQRDRILGVLAHLRALSGGLMVTVFLTDAAESVLRTVSGTT